MYSLSAQCGSGRTWRAEPRDIYSYVINTRMKWDESYTHAPLEHRTRENQSHTTRPGASLGRISCNEELGSISLRFSQNWFSAYRGFSIQYAFGMNLTKFALFLLLLQSFSDQLNIWPSFAFCWDLLQ